MKMVPGKLYVIKKPIYFYYNEESINGMKYYPGTKVMFLNLKHNDDDTANSFHLYFLVGHKKLHYDVYHPYDKALELETDFFEELS